MNDDFRTYNDDTAHNMWVDYTGEQYENSGACHSYGHTTRNEISLSRDVLRHYIDTQPKSLNASEHRIFCIREQIRRYKQSLGCLEKSIERITSPRKLKIYQDRFTETCNLIANLQQQLAEEEANWRNIKARNIKLMTLLVLAASISIIIYVCL